METNLIYGVKDKPSWGKIIIFALQQLLAILAATITVPAIIGHGMSQAAALFGAGVGTLIYLLFTKFKSPVFLGSSFAFIGSMVAAFGGAASLAIGYFGIVLGAILAGLVYVIISVIVKTCGTKWIDKIMPPVVIGPTVAIIGLSLAGNAVANIFGTAIKAESYEWSLYLGLSLLCGLVTLATTIACSVYGKKMMKMIPFIIGIAAGYIVAAIITLIGYHACKNAECMLIDFSSFEAITKASSWYPQFTFLKAFGVFIDGEGTAFSQFGTAGNPKFIAYLGTIAIAYIPVAFVVFAEHIADHKNLSSIINQELLDDPGLDKTLLGDGIGSMAGAFFGGCPNTTYGESVGCVAISGNASVRTIWVTALMAIGCAFLAPFTLLLASIPTCVMGGVCFTLYGFIAVSGLKMLQPVDLNDNRNLFTVSVILIAGIGYFCITFTSSAGTIKLTEVACALILGIITNVCCNLKKEEKVEAKPYDADETEASIIDSLEDNE